MWGRRNEVEFPQVRADTPVWRNVVYQERMNCFTDNKVKWWHFLDFQFIISHRVEPLSFTTCRQAKSAPTSKVSRGNAVTPPRLQNTIGQNKEAGPKRSDSAPFSHHYGCSAGISKIKLAFCQNATNSPRSLRTRGKAGEGTVVWLWFPLLQSNSVFWDETQTPSSAEGI